MCFPVNHANFFPCQEVSSSWFPFTTCTFIHDLFSSIGVPNWNHIHESSNFTKSEFNRRCFPEKFPRFSDLWLLLVVATDRIAKKVSVEETSDVFWNTYNNYDISIFPGFLTRFGSLCLPEYHMLYYIIYWVSFYSF